MDGDSRDDIVIGAIANADVGYHGGAAYLVFGESAPASASVSAAVQYSGAGIGDNAGVDVAGAGDFNADGYADVLIGAYGNDDAYSAAGAAYLILGSGL